MVLKRGESIHVVTGKLFGTDLFRHFIGEITALSESLARVRGYAYIFDTRTNQYIRQPERRTRIVSLVDARVLVNILPADAKIEKAVYKVNEEKELCVTDGESFSLKINEFGAMR